MQTQRLQSVERIDEETEVDDLKETGLGEAAEMLARKPKGSKFGLFEVFVDHNEDFKRKKIP